MDPLNPLESTAVQHEILKEIAASDDAWNQLMEHDCNVKKKRAHYNDYLQSVYNDVLKPGLVNQLQKNGVACIPVSNDDLSRCKAEFSAMINNGDLKFKAPKTTYNPSRSRQQVSDLPKLVSLLQKHNILTDNLTYEIVKYFESFEAEIGTFDFIEIVSCMILQPNLKRAHSSCNSASAIQNLHTDHLLGAGGELVLGVDLSGSDLGTRYYAGSHLSMANIHDKNKARIYRLSRSLRDYHFDVKGLSVNFGENENSSARCSLAHLIHYLNFMWARNDGHPRYVEGQCPALLFDAGGLHSGNANNSEGPRLFLTVRTNKFSREWLKFTSHAVHGTTDTWHPQRPRVLLFKKSL